MGLPVRRQYPAAVPAACRRYHDPFGDRADLHSDGEGDLGIDLVHFGVVVVVNIMIGLVTPPYGLLLFVVANMTRQPQVDCARGDPVHRRCARDPRVDHRGPRGRALVAEIHWLQGRIESRARNQMSKPIYILNGPNLNRPGMRERRSTARQRRRCRGVMPCGGAECRNRVSAIEQRVAVDRLDQRSDRPRRRDHHQPGRLHLHLDRGP